ncbi:hypothetical protein GCM10010218_49780 [Streptomyces mashuensis]|uniref:Uncharacterized protein n=1 Tax=Streptomyces mashuensis TaxID=33904 RepID=A0A919B7W6_9ACTN|nr:hypothetical protein GCM10010218_49780 [Streptomyces mashuensis]
MPVAFETNSERSGAYFAHRGRLTRGARNRFSQSGMEAVNDPLLSVMSPILRRPAVTRWAVAEPVDNHPVDKAT